MKTLHLLGVPPQGTPSSRAQSQVPEPKPPEPELPAVELFQCLALEALEALEAVTGEGVKIHIYI